MRFQYARAIRAAVRFGGGRRGSHTDHATPVRHIAMRVAIHGVSVSLRFASALHHYCIIVSRTSFQSFIRYCTPRDSLTNSRVVRGVWVPVPGLVATTCLVLSCPVLSCPVLATAWPRGRAIFGSLERFTGLLIEVRKRISFAMPFYTKMIMFTKTGSGQTKHWESSTQKEVCVVLALRRRLPALARADPAAAAAD